MNTLAKTLALLALAFPAFSLPEASSLDEALDIARRQNRSVYMELTGTDWCTACIHLRTKILDSPEFDQAMGGKLILFAVDYPRTPELVAKITPEQWKEREALLASYKIEGLPGAILLDENGLPFDVIHAARPTTADYLPLVEAAFAKRAARDAALAEAAGLQGVERAKALIRALEALPETCRDKYADIAAEIHELDPENTLGFRDLARETRLRVAQTAALYELTGSFKGRFGSEQLKEDLTKIDAFLSDSELVPEVRQMALRTKGDCYALLRDYESMIQALKAAYEAAPDTRLGKKLQNDIRYIETEVLPNLGKETKQ